MTPQEAVNLRGISSLASDIITDDNFAYKSPFPSLDLSSHCFDLSLALSPEHANDSTGILLRDPLLAPL